MIVLDMGSTKYPDAFEPVGPALFDATRRAVLRLLFIHPGERFYQRQIIRAVGRGSGAVQRDLAQLTGAGILKRTVEGRQTYYQANRGCHVFEELHGLIRKTFGAPEVLQRALHPLADKIQLAFIFGSVASGRDTPESDIDLMIVGDGISMHDVVSALAEAQDELRREVNPSIYAAGEFAHKLVEGRHFLSTVAQGPKIFLIGDESKLAGLAEKRVDRPAQVKPRGDRRPLRRRRTRS